MTRRARSGRPAVPAVLLVVLLAALVVIGGPLLGPVTASAHAAQTSGGPASRQVTVTVTRLEPKAISARSTVEVAGTLRNTTSQAMSAPRVRLQTGDVLTSRAQLAATDRTFPPADANTQCPFTPVGKTLAPQQTVAFSTRCPAGTLGLTATGVYPLVVNVNADLFDGTTARVGEADTMLPFFPTPPRAPTELAWLWPLADKPHRLHNGVYRDDELAAAISPQGHLGRMLALANGSGTLPLTVAIDPELVAEVAGMTNGYQVLSGTKKLAGTGGPAATQFLRSLQHLVHQPDVSVIALPYGDPDVVALQAAKLGDKLPEAATQANAVIRRVLRPKNVLDIAWPPGGQLDNDTLDTLVGGKPAGIVLSSGALPATRSSPATGGAVATLPALGGTTRALVTDDELDSLLGATSFPNGPRVAEQRFLAELAMITAEAPNVARTVLVAPPRRWIVPSAYAAPLLADGGSVALPWMTPAAVPSLLNTPATTDRGPLVFPAAAAHAVLTPAQLAPIRQAAAELGDLRGAVTNAAADTLLTPYYRTLFVAASSAWRGHPQEGAPFLGDLSRAVDDLRSLVSVVRPTNGTYSLASSGSPLVLTVENRLPVPAKVQVTVTARGGGGFHAQPVERTIPPHSRPTIKVPAKVVRSGVFTVIAQVRTPDGHALGEGVQLKVRSSAYGTVTLAITGGALALLFLLVGRRLYKRIRTPREKPPPTPVERPVEPVAP